jgi:hypothetical protein
MKKVGIYLKICFSRPYAEKIERFFLDLGIKTDILMPGNHVPKSKLYGSLKSSGTKFALIVEPANVENKSVSYVVSCLKLLSFKATSTGLLAEHVEDYFWLVTEIIRVKGGWRGGGVKKNSY